MPELYMIFARKINKMPEFYTIFARKNSFCPNLGATAHPLSPLSPTSMVVVSSYGSRIAIVITA